VNFSVDTNETKMDYVDMLEMAAGKKCLKKPVVYGYFVITEEMAFHTESGEQMGKPGMVCIVGKDHAWPVTAEYFSENYDTGSLKLI
jgi:hypothetical protein